MARRPARSARGCRSPAVGRRDQAGQSWPLTRSGVTGGRAWPSAQDPQVAGCCPPSACPPQPVDALGWEGVLGGDRPPPPPIRSPGALPPLGLVSVLPPATSSRLLSSVTRPGAAPGAALPGWGWQAPRAGSPRPRGRGGSAEAAALCPWQGRALAAAHVPGVTAGVGAAARPPSWLLGLECLGAAGGPQHPTANPLPGPGPRPSPPQAPGLTSGGAAAPASVGTLPGGQASLGVLRSAANYLVGIPESQPVGRGFGQV